MAERAVGGFTSTASSVSGKLDQPQRPAWVSESARACLDALSASGLGRFVCIGGAFGLAHYFEYRETHDVDAWWVESIASEERDNVLRLLERTLRRFGNVKTRAWGDVVSVELQQQGKTVFSFQIGESVIT